MHSPGDLGSHNLEFGSVDERSGALRTCQIKALIFKGIKVSVFYLKWYLKDSYIFNDCRAVSIFSIVFSIC